MAQRIHIRRKIRNRLAAGALAVAAALAVSLGIIVPGADAGKDQKPIEGARLPKAFKGQLPITELSEDQAILHALNRLAFGPRPGDIGRIRKMGLEKWISRQLNPGSIDDSALAERLQQFPTLKMSSAELLEEFPPPNLAAKRAGLTLEEYRERLKEKRQERARQDAGGGDPARALLDRIEGPQRIIAELSMAKLDRAIYSNRQLYEVMANFWYNHFNVDIAKGADRWLVTSYERDAIRPHAIGKFENLLEATAKSPAMLFYLDNWLSVDPVAYQRMQQELEARRRRFEGIFGGVEKPRPNEFPQPQNFAERQPVRTPSQKIERGLNENYGREIMELHTLGVDGGYTQADVIQVAKCFTGWTIRAPRRNPAFFFDDRFHATGPKAVLGKKIDYGEMKDGEAVLRILATSPATAHHIAYELAEHFVSDNPPPALVDRLAQTFLDSDGDTRAVLRAMIYSPEFWSRAAYRAKVKTPFELVVSAARALNANVDEPLRLARWVDRMGEPLYRCQPPTGYSDTAETWVNAGALLNRLNFALALATNRVFGAPVDLPSLFGQDASADPYLALSRALDVLLDGQVAASTRATLEAQLRDPLILQAKLDDPIRRVNEGLIAGLVLGARSRRLPRRTRKSWSCSSSAARWTD